MRSGKVNTIWLFVGALVLATCIGGSLLFTSFAGLVKKSVEDKQKQKSAETAMTQNVRNVLEGQELGKRPTFADTPYGRQQALTYDYLAFTVSSQKKLLSDLEAIKFDWVMSAEAIKTKEGLNESLRRVEAARLIVKKFYTELETKYGAMMVKLKAEAESDRTAKNFLAGFLAHSEGPNGPMVLQRAARSALARNHDALEGCIKTLQSLSGKYSVDSEASLTFDASVPDSTINKYNAYVEATNLTLNELNSLEARRIQIANDVLKKSD